MFTIVIFKKLFKLKFNIPYKLVRKVLLEKSGINKHIRIPTTKLIKIMKLKKSTSISISILSGIIFAYMNMFLISLSINLMSWQPGVRIGFLVYVIFSPFIVSYYCRHHYVEGESGRSEELKIDYLSGDWFKKLFSVYIVYFLVLFVFAFLISFCAMSTNINEMIQVDRIICVVFISIITIVLCRPVHESPFIFELAVLITF